MSAGTKALVLDDDAPSLSNSTSPVIRFLKGAHLLGQCAINPGETIVEHAEACLLYTSPSPRDRTRSRMPSSA